MLWGSTTPSLFGCAMWHLLCTQVPNVMADDASWRVTTQDAMMNREEGTTKYAKSAKR